MVTPLASMILKDSLLPKSKRKMEDPANIADRMDDIHCFEISDILDLTVDMYASIEKENGIREEFAFLPFPKTWIEWRLPQNKGMEFRTGFLLEQTQDNKVLVSHAMGIIGTEIVSSVPDRFKFSLKDLYGGQLSSHPTKADILKNADESHWMAPMISIGSIPLINSPRFIGRIQHNIHSGLQRRLLRARGPMGKFPLHAWTEVVLRVTPPKDCGHEVPKEGYLTGLRARHWVRAHLRIRLGKLEFVSAHERGDESLGYRQQRYVLKS